MESEAEGEKGRKENRKGQVETGREMEKGGWRPSSELKRKKPTPLRVGMFTVSMNRWMLSAW